MNSTLVTVFLVTLGGGVLGSVAAVLMNWATKPESRLRLDASLGVGAAIGAAIGAMVGVFASLMGRFN